MPTFETPKPITLDVELGVGDIRIDASERTDTVVEVLPTDPGKPGDVTAAEQTRVDLADTRLVIRGPRGWRQWTPGAGASRSTCGSRSPRDRTSRATPASPPCGARASSARCGSKTGVGDIDVDHAGSVAIRTGAGEISVGHAAGNLTASTGAGVVRIAEVEGSAVIKSSNRETWIGDVGGDLRVKAADGSISVDRAGATVTLKTANGDIHLGEVAPGTVVAQTAFGKIDVGIREGVAAWLDLNTGFGRVHNDLTDAERPGAGEETVEVRARTSYGDISIRRAPAA